MKLLARILGYDTETNHVKGQEITPFSVAEDYLSAKLYDNGFRFPEKSWLQRRRKELREEAQNDFPESL